MLDRFLLQLQEFKVNQKLETCFKDVDLGKVFTVRIENFWLIMWKTKLRPLCVILLPSCRRHMQGEDLQVLSIPDLLNLEQQLDTGASRVRARKASTIWDSYWGNVIPVISTRLKFELLENWMMLQLTQYSLKNLLELWHKYLLAADSLQAHFKALSVLHLSFVLWDREPYAKQI